jgi:hypothetical protein
MTAFSVTLTFWACVTLGFSNSAETGTYGGLDHTIGDFKVDFLGEHEPIFR